MLQTLKNAWRTPELKKKLLFTLLIVLLYRLGAAIPVPFIDAELMQGFADNTAGSLFQYMNLLSGGAFAQGTLFALNVSPYITASIVIQLLTIAIPVFEKWSKDGEAGRKKLNMVTRIVTVALALVTAYGYTKLLDAGFSVGGTSYSYLTANGQTVFGKAIIVACFCGGAAMIMWMAERIDEHGIGNGISMILFANIISRVPQLLGEVWGMTFTDGGFSGFSGLGLVKSILSLILTLGIVVLIVWFTESERRIPVQYAKRQVGRKMYGGQTSHLPLKMNMAGVMPVIFASSIVTIPATIAGFLKETSGFKKFVTNWFSANTWPYLVVELILIFLFSYFYILISFNPVEVSNNIRSQGGAVPGIRPGKPTADYITRILNRITTIGAIFLAVVIGVPGLISIIDPTFAGGLAFTGTSILIVVGVALETFRDLEAQLSMRNYKGFLD